MQEQLRINRQILSDLASCYLEPLPGNIARLVYLASLRDPTTGNYAHRDLSLVYRPEAVHQALSNCHEELFERCLELSLVEQQQELLKYLQEARIEIPADPVECRKYLEAWMPPQAPDYLKELFQSNLQTLCALLNERSSKARSNT